MTFTTFIIKNAMIIMIICLIITGVITIIYVNLPKEYWTNTQIRYEDSTPYSKSPSLTQEIKKDVSDKQGVISVKFEEVPTKLEELERVIEEYEDCMGGGCGRLFMSKIMETKGA